MRRASMPNSVRGVVPAVALGALLAGLLPSSALAQATRTWVSGTGDDANPCSRAAPCKTFAGAFFKTAVGGEINAQDPGGFGAVTITHAVTISVTGVGAGVLVTSGNGITVSAGSTDRVTLRGLDINGAGTAGTSQAGVNAVSVGTLRVERSQIYGFVNGVNFQPTNAGARLIVQDTQIHGNSGDGIVVGRGRPAAGRTGRDSRRRRGRSGRRRSAATSAGGCGRARCRHRAGHRGWAEWSGSRSGRSRVRRRRR
jgi:hypothetical protein